MNHTHAQAIQALDTYRTLLSKSLHVLSTETVATMLNNCEQAIHTADDMGERMEANAMIVGILTVMCEEMQDAKENP